MNESAKSSLEQINQKLSHLPVSVAEDAINQYTARMEGYADGFTAGAAYAKEGK